MKRDWTSQTAILLIGLILVVLNVIGLNLFVRFDLTDDKVYSLSEASKELVQNLEDPVTFTAFFTQDLPAPYSTNRRFLRDKLEEYRAYGGGNVQYKFVDPASDDELRQQASRYQIPPVQIRVIESDNVQLKNAYMGVAIQYQGERETIPVVQELSSLEYEITSALRRLTREELPTLGFLSGHGEPNPAQDLQTLHQELQRNYNVQTVTVSDTMLQPYPDALMIVAPSDSLPREHLQAIDDYLMQGGRVGMLLNRVAADLQRGQGRPQFVGLEPLLSSYGVSLNTDLVLDRESSVVTVQRRQGPFNLAQQIEYPPLPVASRFNEDHPMVSRQGEVMFYFVSSIDTTQAPPAGVEMEPLVLSSSQSSTQEGYFMLQPAMLQNADLSKGPFTLAAAYTGTFPSAFDASLTSPDTRLVVVGDGDLLNESIVGRIPGNVEFGLNMADWLAQDDALLAIRSKKVEPRSLDEVSEGARPWIKYSNMIGPVLLVVLFGVAQWRRRKARQVVLVR